MRNVLIAAASVLAMASQTAIAQTATTKDDAKASTGAMTGSPGATTGTAGATSTTAAGATRAEAGAPNMARASGLIGRKIENPSGDNIGEVEDLVLDPKTGQVQQVIVGVGGFLGIGQKDVALQWNQLEIQQEVRRTAAAPAPGAPGSAMAPGTPATSPVPGTPATRADGKPATEPSPTAPRTGAEPATRGVVATGRPRIVVNMTKEQLQAAPEFRFAEERASTGSMAPASAPTAPAGGTTRK